MRKSLWIAFLVIVLCVGLGVTGFVRLNESGKQIQYEETVLFGDKTAIDGLTVRHQLYTPIAENGRYLYWDTTYRPAEGIAEAEYTYREKKLEAPVENREFLNIGTYHSGGMQTTGTIDLREQGGVWAPVLIDVAERAGTELYYTESVDLRDYFEYYPLSIDVNLGTLQFYMSTVIWDSTMEEWMKILQEEFRIPLTEKCYVKIEIFKRTNGGVYQYHISSEWSPSFYGRSLITEKYCYLLIDGKEKATDSSRVRDYWAIYRIPYETAEDAEGQVKTTLHLEEMEKLLTVDPGISVGLIRYDEKRGRIELIYEEPCGEELSPRKLMVIDGKTGEIVQETTLIDRGENLSIHRIYCREDFMVITVKEPVVDGKKGFILLERTGNGSYCVAHEGEFPKAEAYDDEIWVSSKAEVGMDFDGERLVMAAVKGGYYLSEREPSVFQIVVYEGGELIFHGQYKSSLGIGEDIYNGCQPWNKTPITVSWD